VPACFISGKQDWGTYQRPGVYEAMQTIACTRMIGCHLIEGAGHWVQQEQPQQVSHLLLQFVKQAGVSWPRLSEQNLRVDKWSVCRG
jgi:pimeloyl-ACP methyl ester carboxylesterase